MDAAIDLANVAKSYRSWRVTTQAVDGASLTVERGQCHVLLGANGAGKSTLIGTALGFIRPDSGVVKLRGQSPEEPDSRRSVGYLPEVFWPLAATTPRRLLMHLARLARPRGMSDATISQGIDAMLRDADLERVARSGSLTLSKGMRQRLGILQALLHEPEVLVFDEPTSGLDPVWRTWFRDRVEREVRRGAAVLYCTHSLEEASQVANVVSIMHRGRIVETRRAPVSAAELEAVFRETAGVRGTR